MAQRPTHPALRALGAALGVLFFAPTAFAVEKASEQVSPFYGSLSRAIPIEVPPYHGLEPKLALAYSSEGRNGFLGVGWNCPASAPSSVSTPASARPDGTVSTSTFSTASN